MGRGRGNKGKRASEERIFFFDGEKTIFFERRKTTALACRSPHNAAYTSHVYCALEFNLRRIEQLTALALNKKLEKPRNFKPPLLQGPRRALARSGRRPDRLFQLWAHDRELEGLPGPGLPVPRELRPARSDRDLRLCGTERAPSAAPAAAVRPCAANAAAVCGA